MLSVTGQANDMFGVIATQAEWSWANHDGVLAPLTAMKKRVETFKTRSEFFKSWLIQDKFQQHAKRLFASEIIARELKEFDGLQKALDALECQLVSLKQMHKFGAQLADVGS